MVTDGILHIVLLALLDLRFVAANSFFGGILHETADRIIQSRFQLFSKQPTGFLTDENLILYSSGASDEEVLARLPADIVLATAAQCYAEVGNEEYLHQMALAVSVEVCGRLGISPPADAADRLNGLRAHIPAGEERRALEEVREMAKVFGDTVCKELDLQRPRSDLQRTEER